MKFNKTEYLYIFVIVFVSLVSILIYCHIYYTNIIASDLAVFADGARNLYDGKSLVSNLVTPAFLPYYKDIGVPLPYMWYPLLPVVNAALFHIFGIKEWVLLIFPSFCFIGISIVVYLLAEGIFGTIEGFVSALIFAIQPSFLSYTIGGLTDTPFTLLFMLSLLFIFKARNNNFVIFFSGVVFGAMYYARNAGVVYIMPILILLLLMFGKKDYKKYIFFLLGCFLIQAPLFYRNYKITGTLNFLPTFQFLILTQKFPGTTSLYALLPTNYLDILSSFKDDIMRKWISQLWVHYKYIFTLANPFIVAGAMLSFLCFSNDDRKIEEIRRYRTFVIIFCLGLIIFNSFVLWDNRYLAPLVPLLIILFSNFCCKSFDNFAKENRTLKKLYVIIIFVLLIINPYIDAIYQGIKQKHANKIRENGYVNMMEFIKSNVSNAEVVLTDIGSSMAWYTGNIVIDLPIDVETAEEIRKNYLDFDTIILTSERTPNSYFVKSEDWRNAFMSNKDILGFATNKIYEKDNFRVVILRPKDYINEKN